MSRGRLKELARVYWPIALVLLIMIPRVLSAEFGLFDDAETLRVAEDIQNGDWDILAKEAVRGRFRPIYWIQYAHIYALTGAQPAWFFLALTLPAPDLSWLESFAHGMGDLAQSAGVVLAGGDTTMGPLSITITAMGLVEPGTALTRDGARNGELVVVSGQLGDAAHALEILKAGGMPGRKSRAALESPVPRLQLGRQLRGLATSCIDISDGLIADLGHILEASVAGAEINIDLLPCSASMAGLPGGQRRQFQTSGGDDYELCFTIPVSRREELDRIAKECACPLSVIGKINTSLELVCTMNDGNVFVPQGGGYDHF